MPVPFGTLPSRSVDRHVAAAGHAKRDHHGYGGGYGYGTVFLENDGGTCEACICYYRTSRNCYCTYAPTVSWFSQYCEHAVLLCSMRQNRIEHRRVTDGQPLHNSVRGCCQCCCLEEANNACRPALATRHKDAYNPTRMKPSAYALPNKSLFFFK
jgi:hypothetical protein